MVLIFPGSFNAYTTRFFSPAYGFALSWNYWFNDAVSVASDLTAAQLVLQYWTSSHTWIISLLFWVFLVGVNALHVRAYGELGESLASGVLRLLNEITSCGVLAQSIGSPP
jgi:amino acid transporter, AAT family